jgi:hypothetical protein
MGLDEINDRLKKLESKVTWLASVVSFKKHPFIWLCYENDLNTVECDGILAVVSVAENSFVTMEPMKYVDFELAIKKIVPSKMFDAEFPKSVIRALNKENKFILGTKHFKEEGIII